MSMKVQVIMSLLIIALFFLCGSLVHAASVHKWIDEKGVTHYSDQAPDKDVYNAKQIEISGTYVTTDNQTDYYSVTNQWARMREERIERRKLQLEKAKQKAALKQIQVSAVPQVVYRSEREDNDRRRYYPIYPYRFGHHKRFHHFAGKKLGSRNVNGVYNNYRGSSCKLPRGNSRFRGNGLTLSFR